MIIFLGWISKVEDFCLSGPWIYFDTPSDLQHFCKEINWELYGSSLVINSIFLLLYLIFVISIMSLCRSVWVHLVWDTLCFLYLFPSLGLGNFQPKFLQIHFVLPFLFLFLLGSLLSIGWHTLYFPMGLSICSFAWVISIIVSSRSALLYYSICYLLP